MEGRKRKKTDADRFRAGSLPCFRRLLSWPARASKGRLQPQSLGRLFLPGGASERLASRHRTSQRFQFRFGFRTLTRAQDQNNGPRSPFLQLMWDHYGIDANGTMNGNMPCRFLMSLSSAVTSSHFSCSASATYRQS